MTEHAKDGQLSETERLIDALNWALGCGDEFPPREDGQGAYWWRTDLAARAGLTYDKGAGRFVLPPLRAQPSEQVAVKPLEWGPRRTISGVNWAWDAKTSIGWYVAATASGEGCEGTHYWFVVGDTIRGWANSEDEAKAAAQADYDQRIRSALAATPSVPARVEITTHRHKKSGSEYVLIGFGKMQAEKWKTPTIQPDEDGRNHWTHVSIDMREIAIYRSVDDDSLWVRPKEEFEDGRFEALSLPTGEAHPPSVPARVEITEEMEHAGCKAIRPALFAGGLDPLPGDGPATRSAIEETRREVRFVITAALAAQPAGEE